MPFWEYELRADTLCLGERPKGGLFRPCSQRAIRYSAITGALRSLWGEANLHAAGFFLEEVGHNRVDHLTYSPRDNATGANWLPLTIQFLTDVRGLVVVKAPEMLPERFEISMGALKSQGFGHCKFKLVGRAKMEPVRGGLRTRIPVHRAAEFEIHEVVVPIYGYLFEPTSPESGVYVLSLFESSTVYGPICLVEENHE